MSRRRRVRGAEDLIQEAVKVRDEARARKDFSRSNQINSLLYLIREAGDVSEKSLARLDAVVHGIKERAVEEVSSKEPPLYAELEEELTEVL